MNSAVSVALLSVVAVSAAPGLLLDLLNDPRTILSKAPTNTFGITSDNDSQAPNFTGIKLKYVPSLTVAVGQDVDFTVLAPGQAIEVDHTLAGVYNFTSAGEGSYKFAAKNIFNYVDSAGELKLATPSFRNKHARGGASKRAVSFTGCTSSQQTLVSAAATASNTLVADANTYLSTLSSGTTRYTTWFGAYSTSRASTVRSHFSLIGTDATSTNYDCSTCQTNPPIGVTYSTTYAYVYPDTPGKRPSVGDLQSLEQRYNTYTFISTGTDSRAGTIVHENSHFDVNGGTRDITYGQTNAKSFARSNPAQAVSNVDNHEYFAENTPALS
ncbi:peptidyl-Lys metalloendopeptidase, partial [Rhizoctonia solani]